MPDFNYLLAGIFITPEQMIKAHEKIQKDIAQLRDDLQKGQDSFLEYCKKHKETK